MLRSTSCYDPPLRITINSALRRVTDGCEAYTASKQAVRIQLRNRSFVAMPTSLAWRKAVSDPPYMRGGRGVAGVPSPGHAYQGISREPRRAPTSREMVGLVTPNPKTPGSRRARAASAESEQALAARVSRGQGKPEVAVTGRRAVLQLHSTDEGGEPQGSRKGRPRYPLEGRGKQVDVSMQLHRHETLNSRRHVKWN